MYSVLLRQLVGGSMRKIYPGDHLWPKGHFFERTEWKHKK
jgi:hypothetical protein